MLISKNDIQNIEEKVEEFERKYNIVLPEKYRNFLLRYNGGETPDTYYKNGRRKEYIRGFYGIGEFLYSFASLPYLDDFIEKDYLPIASDPFGNKIVIGVGKDNNGKIYFSNHENGFRCTLMTEDFVSFISNVKSKPIDPDYLKPIEVREQELIARGKAANITDVIRNEWQKEIDKYSKIKQEEVIID